MGKIINFPIKRKLKIDPSENSIVVGDCLDCLKYIPSNSIDMCYIDPPFFSNKNYEIIWGNGYELRSFKDRWKGGVKSYIVWMEERVKQIHRVLKSTGSIFLHCDWRASHRLRVMLDDVFGEKNFVNEIVWSYKSGGASKKHFSRKHDVIFFYSKSKKWKFNPQKEKSYNRNFKPYRFKGVKEFKDSIGWYTMVYSKDVWDIDMVGRTSKERIGYPTQKPEKLIEKIINSTTDKGDICLDCFSGGGTTASIATKLKRKFIAIDVSPVAARVIEKRLKQLTPPPHFKILEIPKTKEEWLDMNGIEFEKQICSFMGWEWSGKGVNDGGIDGWANRQTIPIQIKNHRNKVGRPDIQKFVGAMGKHKKGIFVAWDFATNSWDYRVEAKEEYGKDIEFLKVEDILGDILIDSDKKMKIETLIKEKTA